MSDKQSQLVRVVEYILEENLVDSKGSLLRLCLVKQSIHGSADFKSEIETEISTLVQKDGKPETHRVVRKIPSNGASNFRKAAGPIYDIVSARGIHSFLGSGPARKEFSTNIYEDIYFGAIVEKGKFSSYFLEIIDGEQKFRFLMANWEAVGQIDTFFYQVQQMQ
jgi:hypothetical protein